MAATVIDSFLIALGFRVDPSGAAQMKKQTEGAKANLLSLGNAVKAFATGYVVKSVADISNTFEQNTTAIAAMLSTLGKSSDFNAGLLDAERTMARIEADAAKLPGEASDYIEVFRAGLPALVDAMPGASADEIAAFTNRLTAIGTSILQVDPGQLGRDLKLMLGPIGRAGTQVKTFGELLGYMRKLPGQANLSAEAFNKMTQPERLKLLQDTLGNENLTKALDHAAGSFDAMFGAAKSMVKTLIRLGTGALFEGAKEGLDAIRAVFVDDGGKLTSTGQTFVDILQRVGHGVTRMIKLGASAVKMLLRFVDSSIEVKLGLLGIAGAIIGVQKLLKFGLIGAILLVIEDLKTFYEGGQSITGLLVEKWPNAIRVVQGLLVALGGAFVALQVKSLAAAAGAGLAWMVANAPLILMLAGIGALIISITTLISKWEEFKATARGWKNIGVGRFKDAVEGVFGGKQLNEMHARNQYGKELEDIAFRKSGRLTPGALGPAYAAPSAAGGSALSSTPSAPIWERSSLNSAGAASPVTNNTTINVNGARDPRAVADEVAKIQQRQSRNTVRANQKAHAY